MDERPAGAVRAGWAPLSLAFVLGVAIGLILGAAVALGVMDSYLERLERKLGPQNPVYPTGKG